MPKLSAKQVNVIYNNARSLDLPYVKERWLLDTAHETDFMPDAANDLIGCIFEYLNAKNPNPLLQNQLHMDRQKQIIESIIDTYMK